MYYFTTISHCDIPIDVQTTGYVQGFVLFGTLIENCFHASIVNSSLLSFGTVAANIHPIQLLEGVT